MRNLETRKGVWVTPGIRVKDHDPSWLAPHPTQDLLWGARAALIDGNYDPDLHRSWTSVLLVVLWQLGRPCSVITSGPAFVQPPSILQGLVPQKPQRGKSGAALVFLEIYLLLPPGSLRRPAPVTSVPCEHTCNCLIASCGTWLMPVAPCLAQDRACSKCSHSSNKYLHTYC